MFKFWGDGSQAAKDLVDSIVVRSTENFNWTFIFILAVVFYVYWTEIQKKEIKVVSAGLALYGVHWLYEICNAIIAKSSAILCGRSAMTPQHSFFSSVSAGSFP